MLQLHATCENFIVSQESLNRKKKPKQPPSADTAVLSAELEGNNLDDQIGLSRSHATTTTLNGGAEVLSFENDTIGRKRWLETTYLLDDGFLEGAPEEIKGFFKARIELDYDYLKALTRMRN